MFCVECRAMADPNAGEFMHDHAQTVAAVHDLSAHQLWRCRLLLPAIALHKPAGAILGSCRSAYFRLGHLLRQKVQARCVLALTATATRATEAEVATALDIQPENRLRDSNMRDNLRLSVVHHNGGESGLPKAHHEANTVRIAAHVQAEAT